MVVDQAAEVMQRYRDFIVDAPETINEDPYGKGWVALIDMTDAGEMDSLLSAAEYKELVAGEEG